MAPSRLYGPSTFAFDELARQLAPLCGRAALVLMLAGLGLALFLAPTPPQGDVYRIAAIHYPAALTSLTLYLTIGALSVITLRHGTAVTPILAQALAPTALLFTLLALWTEALWRRPLRGIWWTWDAEAVSQLMLLFLLGGFIALRAMIHDTRRADRAGALLALIGVANLPVLYFSIHWWGLLRHEARPVTPVFSGELLLAVALVGLGFAAYSLHATFKRASCLIAERENLALDLRRMMEPDR